MAEQSGDVEPETLVLVKKAIRHDFDLDFVKKVKVEYKGEKIETRVLASSAYRVYIVSTNKTIGKVESSFHMLSVQQIDSPKPHLLNITAAEKVYSIKLFQPKDSVEIIAQIQAALKSSFPCGTPDRFRLTLGPPEEAESRQEQVNNFVNTSIDTDAQTEIGPCGGFSKVYACMCDYYGSRYLEEVAWDVDTIYLSHNTKEFNLQDFDHLDQKDLVPIIAVLEYNSWFTKLICRSFKLGSDVCDVIIKVIKKSTSLEELVFDGVSLGRDFFHKVGLAMTSNPKTALHSFDFSNNAMEDRGLGHLTGSFNKSQGLVSLSLVDNSLTVKGTLSLVSSFKSSKYVQSSLKRLNISKNPLKAEGVTALSDFLAQPNALTHLDLSYTDCSLDLLFAALMRGCVQNLMHLNLAGNNFTTKKKEVAVQQSFQQFFSLAQDLKFVDLSNCKLPPEAVRAVFKGLCENENLKDVELDISKNELKGPGAIVLADSLKEVKNIKKLNISDNGFEGDFVNVLESLVQNECIQELLIGQNFKARTSNAAIEALVQLISEENSHINSLSLADSKLKQDIISLLDALGTNETLIKLDISGNSIGDEGARILAKALQLNSKLRTLVMDKNNISYRGFNDIAAALESNHTLYSIPSPLQDVSQCIKSHGTQCEQNLRKIEEFLLRNQSPHKKVAEQAYRLQQGLLVASTQQQAVDRLIVLLQDNVYALRHSEEENVQQEVNVAKQYIQDADKLKQLLLKFHLCTDDNDIEAEFTKLSEKFYQASQNKIKDNLEKILECAKEVCPYITRKEDVQENMTAITTSHQRISQTFVEEVILSQAAATIMNRISENKLSVASIMADTLMDMVIRHMETSNVSLELLLKEHRQKQAKTEDQDSGLDSTDDVALVHAARKAKNRLSSALLVTGENSEEVPKSHKRRPTVSIKKPKANSISEENLAVDTEQEDAKEVEKKTEEVKLVKKSPMVTKKTKAPATPKLAVSNDLDFCAVEQKTSGLDHLGKSRPRPARGRRLPTRPSNRPQVTNGVSNEEPEVNIDHFWAAPSENEHVKTPTKVPPARPTPPKPAPKPAPKPRPGPKPDETKKPGWIPKGGINLGLPGFFKKKRDRSGSGNDNDQTAVKDKDKKSPTPSPKETKAPPKPARPVSVLPPKPAVKPRDRLGTAPNARSRAGSNTASDVTKPVVGKEHSKEETPPERPAPPRGPPKFGIGLGGMAGGGLLAEMKMRQERSGSTGKTPPETVPKPARRPSTENRNKPEVIRKTSKEEESPPTRPRLPTGESQPDAISEEGLVRPSSIKRPRTSSQTPPKPQAKPREKEKEHEEKKEEKSKEAEKSEKKAEEKKKEEKKKEEERMEEKKKEEEKREERKKEEEKREERKKEEEKREERKKEETRKQEEKKKEEERMEEKKKEEKKKEKVEVKKAEPTMAVLNLGEEIGESVDGVHEERKTTEKEKLKLKVKPDDTDSDLWVKRDSPSPKRSPKSNKAPTPISADTDHIKTDIKPMSPITRAATLPKPWSPNARSLPRKYSFEADEGKDDGRLRTKSTGEEKKPTRVKNDKDEKQEHEGLQKNFSPFRLSPKKPSKEPIDDTPSHDKDDTTEQLSDDLKDGLDQDTTTKKEEEKKLAPLDVVLDDPLGAHTLNTNDSSTSNSRPISTCSDNTSL